MSHLGDPWIAETIAMLLKHPNVYAMTAGWAPKYVSEDVLRFAERRNPRKLMWASDYPILPMDRTVTEGAHWLSPGRAGSDTSAPTQSRSLAARTEPTGKDSYGTAR